ncbi:hypothetical protein IW261DRAFT_1344233 [Armillaria novae-zelandiae]|uniref:Uncharacterized protein n=1 Tax=Armillaria novae-zelandiae TaxID=153914 RepID=A0AA39NUA6_9AGAR|nr:hypothetical protein IW261DRAFT_1344233 [Armillaria novae-zelandiae]
MIVKCQSHFGTNRLLIIDEISMLDKIFLCKLSDTATITQCQLDFHQFPPVTKSHAALYDPSSSTDNAMRGHELYHQFQTVILLKEQLCVNDDVWMAFLNCLQMGICTVQDMELTDSVCLDSPSCLPTNLHTSPWEDAVFITSRNSV